MANEMLDFPTATPIHYCLIALVSLTLLDGHVDTVTDAEQHGV